MNQTAVLLIIGLFILLAAVGLGIALFGFERSVRQSERRRRESQESRNRLSQGSSIRARSSGLKIEFGETLEDHAPYPQAAYATVTNSTKEHCLLCRRRFVDEDDRIKCPNCEAEYHRDCLTEDGNTCRNCGGSLQ
jgi:hypothetical protein